ncbi:MAG TPA: SRPBCC domain-containing protein [Vicinamibacterales bacterium]|nr:SRPBCC domain-containing protein [Vicinamibacterales bacterium]
MYLPDAPAPSEGFLVTHSLTVSDQARSRTFYAGLLGGTVVYPESPCIIRLANSWIILNRGGGPTPDKPDIILEPPLRVADIQARHVEWKGKGAEFLTEPLDNHGWETRCYMRDPDGYIIEVGQPSEKMVALLTRHAGSPHAGGTGSAGSMTPPDLSSRPLRLSCERLMVAPPAVLFPAWTSSAIGRWFASPGTVLMTPHLNAPYFFETHFEGQRHPHHGRFLRLEPDRLVEMTWLTAAGTRGVEAVLTIELTPSGRGTQLTLGPAGFPDEESRAGHAENWPIALEYLGKAFPASS